MRGLAFAALLLLLPAAAADLEIGLVAEPVVVRPGVGSSNVTVSLSLECSQVLARTGGSLVGADVTVQLVRTGDPAVTWSGPATVSIPAGPCRDDPTLARSTATAEYLAGLQGSGLAAFAPQDSTVTASIPEAIPEAAPAQAATASFALQAAAVPSLQVEAPVRRIQLQGPTATVPLRFTNMGNVAVTLDVQATLRNQTAGGSFQLGPVEVARGASADATGTFQAPTGPWSSQAVLLDITPVAQGGTERGVTLHVEVVFLAPEQEESAPLAPAGFLPLLLLAAAAFATRRP